MMKKVVMNILFVLLCAAVAAASALGGLIAATRHLAVKRYGYLKVDFTEKVGTKIPDIRYGEDPLQSFDLYLPADQSRENYSLILYIHGGGFTGGDKSSIDAVRYGEYLASKGYVAASANYRLATESNGIAIGDMYEDLITATKVIVQEAQARGYHLTEMATTGGSAGGCLAMLLAFKEPDQLPIPIRFVFEETGPASFDPELWDIQTDDEKASFVDYVSGKQFTASDVGSTEYQNAIDEISAAAMIRTDSVPILLAYGPKDQVVNVKAKYPLLDALDAKGVTHTYIEFPHSGHGLLGDPDKTREWFAAMEDYLSQYFERN